MKQVVRLIPGADSNTDRTMVPIINPPVQTLHSMYWPFQHSWYIVFIPGFIGHIARHESLAGAVFCAKRTFFAELLNTDIYGGIGD